eukprot:scaffold56724_cov67-Phaeocystis_antarctica.AAC.4
MLLDPAFDVPHALISRSGAFCIVLCHRLRRRLIVPYALASCNGAACLALRCQPPPKVAGAAVLSRGSEAPEELRNRSHQIRRVEELYFDALSFELGQPAG